MERICSEERIIVRRLKVSGAFHTEFMRPAYEELKKVLSTVQIMKPRIPIVSNVDGLPHEDPDEIRSLLSQQLTSPVLWEQSMNYLLDQECNQFVEVGVGQVLTGLMKHIQNNRVGHRANTVNFTV